MSAKVLWLLLWQNHYTIRAFRVWPFRCFHARGTWHQPEKIETSRCLAARMFERNRATETGEATENAGLNQVLTQTAAQEKPRILDQLVQGKRLGLQVGLCNQEWPAHPLQSHDNAGLVALRRGCERNAEPGGGGGNRLRKVTSTNEAPR